MYIFEKSIEIRFVFEKLYLMFAPFGKLWTSPDFAYDTLMNDIKTSKTSFKIYIYQVRGNLVKALSEPKFDVFHITICAC